MAQYLPIVDVSTTFRGSVQAIDEVAAQIDRAARHFGFFYVVGHSVPSTLTAAMFDASRRFFALPEAEKRAIEIARSPSFRGYDPMGLQSLDPGKPADLKEGFNIGAPFAEGVDRISRRHSPNQWPSEACVSGFRATAEAYFHALDGLGRHLMGLLAVALGLSRDYFEPSLTRSLSTLRLLHYPPQEVVVDPAEMGCGAHTDWGGLTLLAQDQVGGLEVMGEQGIWHPVPHVPDSFVINLGDLVARWTNDLYRSTLHRVQNRVSGKDRLSLPYFFEVNEDTVISALPGCASVDRPARYPVVSAGEHLMMKYEESKRL